MVAVDEGGGDQGRVIGPHIALLIGPHIALLVLV